MFCIVLAPRRVFLSSYMEPLGSCSSRSPQEPNNDELVLSFTMQDRPGFLRIATAKTSVYAGLVLFFTIQNGPGFLPCVTARTRFMLASSYFLQYRMDPGSCSTSQQEPVLCWPRPIFHKTEWTRVLAACEKSISSLIF